MSGNMSKYAAKKARQEATGEVGYIVKITPAEQSARDKALSAVKAAQDHGEVALHINGFIGRMEDAAKALSDSAVTIALAQAKAHNRVKGEVLAITGLFAVANEKAQAALLRARMLLAVLEGAKGAK